MNSPDSRRRILIEVAALFSDGAADPRPLADACLALERLAELGEPVILVGEELAGRRLPRDRQDRLDWVRGVLAAPGRVIVAVDEDAGLSDGAQPDPAERWAHLQVAWDTDTLITSSRSSVVPARRAGLRVVCVGPREPALRPTMSRADHEARDLLHAVRQLVAVDAFDTPAEAPPQVEPAFISSLRPSPANPPDVLQRGQPGDG